VSRLSAVQGETFDVAIVGGGIVGCGVARDAALRGLRVILFEQRDFGGGTTSASTRIVHGGLRYLETADFRLVRIDLRERETLLRIAPHLVKPLEFTIPFSGISGWERLRLRVGLTLYDALAFDSSLPRHRASQSEASYYDARVDSPERLSLENLIDAAAHAALAFNYVEVTGADWKPDGPVAVRVRDRINGEEAQIAARTVVNASGPWFEGVSRTMVGESPGRIRMTKGVHLVVPPITDRALVLFSAVDKRLMFAIPRAGLTWLGTTDTDYSGDPAEAAASRADVQYVIASLKGTFPDLKADDVLYTTAGVRALVMQRGSTSSVSRMHRVVDGEVVGRPGLVSVMGGKITGYRAIAEDATDLVCQRLRVRAACKTRDASLPGGSPTPAASDPTTRHLYDLYGSRAQSVLALTEGRPELLRPLSPWYPDIGAQVVLAVRSEYCLTVEDFMRRRTLLGASADQGWDAAGAVADIMAGELRWSAEERKQQIEAYRRDIEKRYAFRGPGTRARISRRHGR